MATINSFELLGTDENDGPTQLLAAAAAAKQKAEARKQAVAETAGKGAQPAPAKLPTKPPPPAQAVKESRSCSAPSRGGYGRGERGRGRGGRGYCQNRDYGSEDANGFQGGYGAGGGARAGGKEGAQDGPRPPYRGGGGGRWGGYSDGEFGDDSERPPRRPYERHSGTGCGNWGTTTDEIIVRETEEGPKLEEKAIPEKQGALLDTPQAEENKDATANEEEKEEDKEMTLEEFEKIREEKRKALLALETEERKVEVDRDLHSMQPLANKKGNDEIFVKLGSDKDALKKKENAERDERAKKKSLGANLTARRRPLTVVSGNKARPALESLIGKPLPPAAPTTPAARATAAEVNMALDRLLFAGSDLAGIVSQVDELISDALKCQTLSKRATQEIESFNGFLTDTKASFKQWSSRLKQALETVLVKTEAISKNTPGTCLNTAAKGNDKLISGSSKLPDTDPVESPCSNFAEADMIVSPSPLVSWHTGSCMVESGKQLFHLTPLSKTESRCTTSKTKMKTASSIYQLNNLLRPVSKLTSSDNHPDLEQSVKVKESWTGTMTPHVAPANKVPLEDKLCLPCTSSIQKSRALPRSCLKTALSSKQQFSPIPEGSRKEDIDSNGPTGDDKRSGSSDEISKDLASRYDIYGLNRSTSTRQAEEPLQWFLSPLKTMVLTEPSSDNNPLPTPAMSNLEGKLNVPDDKPIQTPVVHSKALLGTPWKGMESTNLKGRLAGETTLKKELWTRFEAASANELHFDKVRFQKTDAKCFLDMLEEEAS